MKSKIKIFVLSCVFFLSFNVLSSACDTDLVPKEVKRIEILLKQKKNFLDNKDKAVLEKLYKKLKNNNILTQEELDYIRDSELSVIKIKLGEGLFKEYENLILKRRDSTQFTQDEQFRILELEKIINSK